MKNNMGATDKLIRIIVAIILIMVFYSGTLQDTSGVIVLLIAFALTLSSLFGFCPLYAIFGINTCKKRK